MRVFLSYGMHSVSKEKQEERKEYLKSSGKVIFGSDTEFIDNSDMKGSPEDGRLYYLGGAIQKMDKCDAVIFDEDWDWYRGCEIEMKVAESYGIKYVDLSDCLYTDRSRRKHYYINGKNYISDEKGFRKE